MEKSKSSPRFHHHDSRNHPPPSPPPPPQHTTSTTTTTSSTSSSNHHHAPPPHPISRSDSLNPYPTTFVQADSSSFKQVVQMLTGSPKPDSTHPPVIKSIPIRRNPSSGFKLYERRNSLKNLKINPRNPFLPELLSPSILDFPALVLSPVTPLIPDPFVRSGGGGTTPANNLMETEEDEEEEKAIKEKGFYLHCSPATTPREAEPPRLLPLFPVTSPRVSAGSATASSS
ncbi:VQ motif-containing protein 4 [Linum grandiflorum]